MNLNLYETVVSIIGTVPSEMTFIYAVATIFIYFVIIFCCISPFLFLFKLMDR